MNRKNKMLLYGAVFLGLFATMSAILFFPSSKEPDDMIAHWDFEEGIDTVINDVVNDYNGRCVGAVWTSDAKKGDWALTFGGRAYVSTSLNIDQGGSKTYTFSVWVYPHSTSRGKHQVVSTDNGGFDWSILRHGGLWRVFTGYNDLNTGFSVDVNEWQLLVAVFEPDVGITFYKNTEKFFATGIKYDSSDKSLNIGRNPIYGEYFDGCIDDVRVFDRALTEEEVEALFLLG